MKISMKELERMAEEGLRSSLEGIPFAKIQNFERDRDIGGYQADLVTTVNTPAGTRYFVAEVKSVGQPRAARAAVNQLWRFRENRPDVIPVFIAPYISPASAGLCRQEGKESEVSLGLTSNVKKLLEDREWVRKTEDGLALVEPEKMLAEWSENYSFRKNKVRDYYSLKPVADLEADLATACREKKVPYALTGFWAAARFAPMGRSPRATGSVQN